MTAVDAALATAGKDPAAWWGFAGAGWLTVFAMIFSTVIHTPAAGLRELRDRGAE